MNDFHLAQLNIAEALDDLDSTTMKPFVDQLDEINALAEASPGFVWRLQDELGNATSINVFENPRIIVNMSVWENVEALSNYVYKSAHTKVMARRREWFHVMTSAYHVLWWVEQGHKPTLDEAKARLQQLREQGPGPEAFNFKTVFSKPELV